MISEKPPESPEEAARRAVEESGTLREFRSELEYGRREISDDASDVKDTLTVAENRFDRATVGKQGYQLTDEKKQFDAPGTSPHVEREDAASVVEPEGEFQVAEAADRAQLRSKQSYVDRLVDPKTGRIMTSEEIVDGAIASEMNEKYRGKGVYDADEKYGASKGARFIESYKGVDAFRDFVEGKQDAVSKQVALVQESKIDTSDTKNLEKLADRAGFSKNEKKEFLSEFDSEEGNEVGEIEEIEEADMSA